MSGSVGSGGGNEAPDSVPVASSAAMLWAPAELQEVIAQGVTQLADALMQRRWWMGTAESCTGGGIAYALTALPGSSAWFAGGAVTYTNALKMKMLGVQPDTLSKHGAVSEAVVNEMARGAQERLDCQLSVAVSGIAGPGGGTQTKPVGLVCLGWALSVPDTGLVHVQTESCVFAGGRESVRMQTIASAVQGCLRLLHSIG